jgi:Cu(I)/Ag(I) efflux system membrane protein CusA/SilA
VQNVIEAAIGGENVTTTVEGRRRFPVRVRYYSNYRDDIEKLKDILVTVGSSAENMGNETSDGMENGETTGTNLSGQTSGVIQLPLGVLADIKITTGAYDCK